MTERGAATERIFLAYVLLWLSGTAIRIPILAIPPILPYLQNELKMSGTELGLLSGIPMIVLAIIALPGSTIVRSVGALNALMLGLLVTAVGSALRGFTSTTLMLLATTAVMSVGIAIAQPALPMIVRQWLPSRIGFATSIYSTGMVAGCIFPSGMTIPIILPLVHESWRGSLIAWSSAIFVTLILLWALSPRSDIPADSERTKAFSLAGLDLGIIWRIGLIFGANNCVYFGTNAFIPPLLIEAGQQNLVTSALTAYNTVQLFGSLAVLALSRRMERRRWPYIGAGICILLNLAWLAFSSGETTVYAAAMLGFFSGITLTTGLMLPPLLSDPSEVAKTSAAMFTISYTIAMIGTVVGGAAWDLFGHPRAAFGVLALCALPFIIVSPTLDFSQKK